MRPLQYLSLLEWSARAVGKDRMRLPVAILPPILSAAGISPRFWSRQINALEQQWWRAIGPAQLLDALALRLGRRWLKGRRQSL